MKGREYVTNVHKELWSEQNYAARRNSDNINFSAWISHFLVKIPGNMLISRLNPPFRGGLNGIQDSMLGKMWWELRRSA